MIKIHKWLLNNFGLKILALILAVITWAYVVVEMSKGTEEETEVLYNIFPFRIIAKSISLKANIIGEPVSGYKVITSKVALTPSQILVIGPKSVVEDLIYLQTEPIDIREYTKPLAVKVHLAPIGKLSIPYTEAIEVFIPIEKIEKDDKENSEAGS